VIVYVTVEQRDWIRQHVGAGRTTTDVVLDAIETHLEDLHPEPAPATTGLFTRAAAPATEPGVQLHLRLTGGNLQVLDKVVADKGFPSRSALIRAAVQAAVRA
jgi:Arc/MetJ-type ribon-helix-helix transcriptional regulator